MSRLDALPADQRSVLQLLLRQGKGYDDLSRLLRLEPGEVRTRAYDALDALGPGARGLSEERRHEIADWLLGQQEEEQAARTRAVVQGSPTAGAWAAAVAHELEPLAGGRLPDIPEAASAEASSVAASTPRVSRRGGAILIGVVAAAIIAGIVLLVVPGGDDNKPAATQKAASTTAQDQPKVQAQANLTAPQGAPASQAIAIVQIAQVNGQQKVNAVAQGLPDTSKAAYGIWAYNSRSECRLIGGFDRADDKGHIVYQGNLPADITDVSRYREILVTREPHASPKTPGKIYLRGELQTAATGG
jgi:hypothetical protein